jgi:hypothetical protein
LSPALKVDLPRPRLSDLMNHNEEAVRLRACLSELLASGGRGHAAPRVTREMFPVEA